MQVGFIGAGNMARALARGWGDPVLCTDSGSGRAQALADELGGEAPASNRELAERADLVILAHKPAQLADVASEAAGAAKAVVSLLAGTSQADVRSAYPGVPVFRVEPNTAARSDAACIAFADRRRAGGRRAARARPRAVRRASGTVVDVPERLVDGGRRLLGRRARVLGAAGRGVGRRRGQGRDAGRDGLDAGHARRWPARPSCSVRAAATRSRAARGRLARRHDRARPRRARARRHAGGVRERDGRRGGGLTWKRASRSPSSWGR